MTILEIKQKKTFSKDEYIHLKEGEYAGVYIVEKDWTYRPGNTFNNIEVYSIENGKSLTINDSEARHNFQLLPKEEIAQYEQKVKLSREEDQKQDRVILKKVEESLQAIFPYKWDLILPSKGATVYTLIIKFPKIEITNGKEARHEINDLYVKWTFNKGFTIKDNLKGIRGLLSYVEYKCGYAHSHLPSSSYTSGPLWNPFCLGSGEFAQANTEWAMKGHEFTQEAFELLLYQLDAYVRWESLQGGPYMRIENIAIGDLHVYLQRSQKHKEYKIIVEALEKFPLKFDNINKRFKVENFLLEPIISEIKGITKIKKTSAGEYLHGDVSRSSILEWIEEGNEKGSKKSILTFKGEEIFFKVIALNEDYSESQLLEVAHPDLTKYVAGKLIKKTNHYFIKKYGV